MGFCDSVPGGRMVQRHFRAATGATTPGRHPPNVPPTDRPRPTLSLLSKLISAASRPPLCVCLYWFVGEKRGTSGGMAIPLRRHDTLRCGSDGGARTTTHIQSLQKQQQKFAGQTASKATQQQQQAGRTRKRPDPLPADCCPRALPERRRGNFPRLRPVTYYSPSVGHKRTCAHVNLPGPSRTAHTWAHLT